MRISLLLLWFIRMCFWISNTDAWAKVHVETKHFRWPVGEALKDVPNRAPEPGHCDSLISQLI